jgi:hypothetical protein
MPAGFPARTLLGPINLKELHRAHEKMKREHKSAVAEAMRIAGAQAVEHVRKRSTFRRRKARSLKDDTRTRIVRTRGGKTLRIAWRKKYAPYIEYGTRPHVIKPRRGLYLRFYWPKVGRVVLARKVNHPGTRPYKFGWKATHASYRVMGRRLEQGLARVASRF